MLDAEGAHEAVDDLGMRAAIDLEAHWLAAAALDEFSFDRAHQVRRLHFVDVDVAVARDAEAARMQHFEPGEQVLQPRLHDVGGEDAHPLAVRGGQTRNARQHARHLHDGDAMHLARLARVEQQHREVERLVEQHRERVRRIDRERREHRVDLALEVPVDPIALRLRQLMRLPDLDARLGERRHDRFVPGAVQVFEEVARLLAHAFEFFLRLQAIGVLALKVGIDEFHHAGDADLKELVEILARDGEELQALEERHLVVAGLGHHAAIEREP